MAYYLDGTKVLKAQPHPIYETEHKPGTPVTASGIYRCKNCGDEYALNKGTVFPTQNHTQHPSNLPIIWKMLVVTQVVK